MMSKYSIVKLFAYIIYDDTFCYQPEVQPPLCDPRYTLKSYVIRANDDGTVFISPDPTIKVKLPYTPFKKDIMYTVKGYLNAE